MRNTCLNMVHTLAEGDPRILFLGSDLGAGTLKAFQAQFPERFFMEGVMEQNLIGMAAGLAMEGFIPYVNTIATFLTRRCYEQLTVDLCMHNLPVRLIGNGGGLVYAPLGPTHLATEDIAILRALPNMTIVAPTDAQEMKRFMAQTPDYPGPLYIRLGRGGDPIVSREEDGFTIGRAILLRPGNDVALIATGTQVYRAIRAAQQLADDGIECAVLNVHTLKPLDEQAVLTLAEQTPLLVTIEEHSRIGGLGSAVAELLADHPPTTRPLLRRMALPDAFPDAYGSQDELLTRYGLQPEHIIQTVQDSLRSLA